MKRKFNLSDYNSFFMRFMLSHCPEPADNYEIVSCEVETMQSSEPKRLFKQLLIWVNLRHICTEAKCHLCLETLNLNVKFGEGWIKTGNTAKLGCYSGHFFQCALARDNDSQLVLELSLYNTMAYYANDTTEMLEALALAMGDEAVEKVCLKKVAPEPKMLKGCAGYAWDLDNGKALFLYADGNAVVKIWSQCEQAELTPCVKQKVVQQENGKFYYATETKVVVRSNKFISAKDAKVYEKAILQRYPNAKFWEMPIPAIYHGCCWLMAEAFVMPNDCYIVLNLESGEIKAVDKFYFYQYGGLAAATDKNFSWK